MNTVGGAANMNSILSIKLDMRTIDIRIDVEMPYNHYYIDADTVDMDCDVK